MPGRNGTKAIARTVAARRSRLRERLAGAGPLAILDDAFEPLDELSDHADGGFAALLFYRAPSWTTPLRRRT
jgi:hypothetical protein